LTYRTELWEIAATHNGVVTSAWAGDMGVPAVEVRKLASRGFLERVGHGVYRHLAVPSTPFTEYSVAVALAGPGAFLHRDAVLTLLGLGQLNPGRIRVATARRVRRALPEWLDLEYRTDVDPEEITEYEGVPSTTLLRALIDTRQRIPSDRWEAIIDQARRAGLVDVRDVGGEAIL
jgi:predicted transcriptional regulator of viral defense system